MAADIARPEISPIKTETEIKKEPKEPEEAPESKAESDDVKPKTEAGEGAEVKTEPVKGWFECFSLTGVHLTPE